MSYVTGLTLNEVLVKTSYFVQSNKPGDRLFQGCPEAYGTGFKVLYKGKTFFVTADHVAHVKDHDLNKRTGEDNVVGVHTYTRQELTAQVILLSGSFTADKIDFRTGKIDLVDVCVTLLTDEQKSTLCTPQIELPERTIEKGEQMIIVCEDGFVEPNVEDTYYVCGHTHPSIKNGIFIQYEKNFKNGLKYKLSDNEHLLFNTEDIIEDENDWRGISGAPIFNQEGKCVGILTSVNAGSKMVWGYSYKTIFMLMDMAINDHTTNSTMKNNNTIQVTYTDQQLRILIEEFIAMQRSEFTFMGVCSYILYRAMEEGRTASNGIYKSNQLEQKDSDRVSIILEKIVAEGRIEKDETKFIKK